MHAHHAVSRFRLGCVSVLLAGLLAGCGEPAKEPGSSSASDPKGGTRRKDMENFMKTQKAGGTSKP